LIPSRTVSLAVSLAVIVFVALPSAYPLAREPPGLFISVDPNTLDIEIGSSGTYVVTVYAQGEWMHGAVELRARDVPNGLSVSFSEPEMELGSDIAVTDMSVAVSEGTPEGTASFTVVALGDEDKGASVSSTQAVTVNIVKVTEPVTEPPETGKTFTTTETRTETVTTTLSTATTTETATVTVTEVITTRTSSIESKTSAEPPQQYDLTLPAVTLAVVLALLAVAYVAWAKR
jgi:hypothetical protein